MKVFQMLSMVALVVSGWITSHAQVAEPEVPGDHFSLEGALELFKKSGSPEEFEKMLNSPDTKVNNLDLNGDGYIDYIRVIDRYEGNVHAFILQAVISDRERRMWQLLSWRSAETARPCCRLSVTKMYMASRRSSNLRAKSGPTPARALPRPW